MSDIIGRIEKVRKEIDAAKATKARLEGQLEQLNSEKDKILAGFKELGVDPKKAGEEIESMEREIEEFLTEAETVIAEYRNAQ